MSYSKRQFVEAAFEEIGLASYVFDLQPEQIDSACRRLDTMMEQWNAVGIRLGYPAPGSPEATDLNAETAVPDAANEPIITNLAVRIAPSVGKAVSAETKATANYGYKTLLARAAMPPEMQFPRTRPAGAGNKPWTYDDPFVRAPIDPILVGDDGVLDFN